MIDHGDLIMLGILGVLALMASVTRQKDMIDEVKKNQEDFINERKRKNN